MALETLYIMMSMKEMLEAKHFYPTDEQLKALLTAYLQTAPKTVSKDEIQSFLETSPLVKEMFPTRKIEITMEKTIRAAIELELPAEQYDEICDDAHLPDEVYNLVKDKLSKAEKDGFADVEYDWAAADPVSQEQLVEW